jgi:hypothetical protein
MSTCKRHGKKWTTNEVLNLQREYELLNLTIEQIAEKHERTTESILFKLHSEGLTPSLYEANRYSKKTNKKKVQMQTKVQTKVNEYEDEDEDVDVSDIDSSSDYDDNEESDISDDEDISVDANMNSLSERVWSLETNVVEISSMVKQMFDNMTMMNKSKSKSKSKSKKLAPLRKQHA